MSAWTHGISEIRFVEITHREAGNRLWNKSVSRHPFNSIRMLARWAKLWGVPRLPTVVTVEFSTRLTRSLGRVRPSTGVIRLNSRLQSAPRELLIEVLCHEAAHVAVHLIHGSEAKPHGPEWCELVRCAGYRPATRLAHPSIPPPPIPQRGRVRFRYRCRICQHDFFVRRKNSRFHCDLCHRAGIVEPLEYIPNP